MVLDAEQACILTMLTIFKQMKMLCDIRWWSQWRLRVKQRTGRFRPNTCNGSTTPSHKVSFHPESGSKIVPGPQQKKSRCTESWPNMGQLAACRHNSFLQHCLMHSLHAVTVPLPAASCSAQMSSLSCWCRTQCDAQANDAADIAVSNMRHSCSSHTAAVFPTGHSVHTA